MASLPENERGVVNKVGARDVVRISMCMTWKYTDAFN
jgi:hypothetical protein